jgi:myo-inositol-1(or 4)-monophosphatase
VAANPKVYAQMVKILAPYSRVLKDDGEAAGDSATPTTHASPSAAAAAPADEVLDALAAAGETAPASAEATPAARKMVRIRKPGAIDAAAPAGDRRDDLHDAPF